MPRRSVETLISWFDDIDHEDEITLNCRAEIERRIQMMIDCLDDLDGDSDLEAETCEGGGDEEEEAWVA